ncbi:hypothetical protein [Streptomyces monashensis]|uniref:Uncharacterized protein n=1 Tax=Streptomyces monashensis TaxID=1678012 RepID=A0A1S2QRE5_9ACTN|nr:hypothetical protein [Streptomyces monashensis]OIK08207.1 hypothetical protein BIV23_00215 [Streptomyces monashensis]
MDNTTRESAPGSDERWARNPPLNCQQRSAARVTSTGCIVWSVPPSEGSGPSEEQHQDHGPDEDERAVQARLFALGVTL